MTPAAWSVEIRDAEQNLLVTIPLRPRASAYRVIEFASPDETAFAVRRGKPEFYSIKCDGVTFRSGDVGGEFSGAELMLDMPANGWIAKYQPVVMRTMQLRIGVEATDGSARAAR